MNVSEQIIDLSIDERDELYVVVHLCYENEEICLRAFNRWAAKGKINGYDIELWTPTDDPFRKGAWDHEDMAMCGKQWSEILTGGSTLWHRFLADFHDIICTQQSQKYADLVAKIKGTRAKSQVAFVSAIASFMAAHLDPSVSTVLSPFVAVGCLALARFGREQLCIKITSYLKGQVTEFGLTIGDVKRELIEAKRTRRNAKRR